MAIREYLTRLDSELCWHFPRLTRWQIEQVNIADGTAMDVDSMRFRWARSAACGAVWANARLPESARAALTYRPRRINGST